MRRGNYAGALAPKIVAEWKAEGFSRHDCERLRCEMNSSIGGLISDETKREITGHVVQSCSMKTFCFVAFWLLLHHDHERYLIEFPFVCPIFISVISNSA